MNHELMELPGVGSVKASQKAINRTQDADIDLAYRGVKSAPDLVLADELAQNANRSPGGVQVATGHGANELIGERGELHRLLTEFHNHASFQFRAIIRRPSQLG